MIRPGLTSRWYEALRFDTATLCAFAASVDTRVLALRLRHCLRLASLPLALPASQKGPPHV